MFDVACLPGCLREFEFVLGQWLRLHGQSNLVSKAITNEARIAGKDCLFHGVSNVIICKNCNQENEETYRFCLGCGSPISKPEPVVVEPAKPAMMECPHCGTQVPGSFKFCGACGGAVHAAIPAAEPAPAASASFEAESKPYESSPNFGAEPVSTFEFEREPVYSSGSMFESAPEVEKPVGTLTVIRADGSEGATISLSKGTTRLGRTSEYETLSSDPFLSPVHASLRYEDGGFVIRDENSLNGVFVRLREDVELQDGDHLRIGQELLKFHEIGKIEPMPAQGEGKALRQASPDPGYWGRLDLVTGPDLVSKAFMLHTEEVTIGREIGTILFRDDGFVSGRHARLSHSNGTTILRDLGSSNGTYLRLRKEQRMESGDLILMGQQLFRLEV